MKTVHFITIMAAALLVACQGGTGTGTNADSAKVTAKDTISYPYTPTYSADFELGDPKYAKIILDIWKDYDNNTLPNHRGAFADTVAVGLANGSTIIAPGDSILAKVIAVRSAMSSAASTVSSWITLKPKGKDETVVCIWGTETDVFKNGTKDTTDLNEVWIFNKGGKIMDMEQFARKQHP